MHVLERVRTSLMRSLPTMVQLLQRDTSSSTGTLRSSQMTPFRQPVSRRRIVIARVSTLAMPAAMQALKARRLSKYLGNVSSAVQCLIASSVLYLSTCPQCTYGNIIVVQSAVLLEPGNSTLTAHCLCAGRQRP